MATLLTYDRTLHTLRAPTHTSQTHALVSVCREIVCLHMPIHSARTFQFIRIYFRGVMDGQSPMFAAPPPVVDDVVSVLCCVYVRRGADTENHHQLHR